MRLGQHHVSNQTIHFLCLHPQITPAAGGVPAKDGLPEEQPWCSSIPSHGCKVRELATIYCSRNTWCGGPHTQDAFSSHRNCYLQHVHTLTHSPKDSFPGVGLLGYLEKLHPPAPLKFCVVDSNGTAYYSIATCQTPSLISQHNSASTLSISKPP